MDYRLDLSTLLLMLRQSTGNLQAEIQNVPKVKGRCKVFLRLEKGLPTACSIKNESGDNVFSNEAGIKFLQNMVLEWHYTEDRLRPDTGKSTSLQTQSPSVSASLIPQRTYPIPQNEFISWPRQYRAIYSLVDGRSSVHFLVNLLGREQEAEQVIEVLKNLEKRGYIFFDRHP